MTIYGLKTEGGRTLIDRHGRSISVTPYIRWVPERGDAMILDNRELPWDDGLCCPEYRNVSLITIQYA